MPIYEFYCGACHTVFNFFSSRVNTRKTPSCPQCGKRLSRKMSMFAVTGRAGEDADMMDDLPLDESKMEKAMGLLAREAEHINEDDPRQAANLMRKLSDMTGLRLGDGMDEALRRMERGEDPDQIESEIGDLLESEDPFVLAGKKQNVRRDRAPRKDETLYDL